jgi:hypothetical protein
LETDSLSNPAISGLVETPTREELPREGVGAVTGGIQGPAPRGVVGDGEGWPPEDIANLVEYGRPAENGGRGEGGQTEGREMRERQARAPNLAIYDWIGKEVSAVYAVYLHFGVFKPSNKSVFLDLK